MPAATESVTQGRPTVFQRRAKAPNVFQIASARDNTLGVPWNYPLRTPFQGSVLNLSTRSRASAPSGQSPPAGRPDKRGVRLFAGNLSGAIPPIRNNLLRPRRNGLTDRDIHNPGLFPSHGPEAYDSRARIHDKPGNHHKAQRDRLLAQ